jgi:hypothetical protein
MTFIIELINVSKKNLMRITKDVTLKETRSARSDDGYAIELTGDKENSRDPLLRSVAPICHTCRNQSSSGSRRWILLTSEVARLVGEIFTGIHLHIEIRREVGTFRAKDGSFRQ